MDEWQRLNISARIHWASFPGGFGVYENAFQAFPVNDGPPMVRLCTGEQFDPEHAKAKPAPPETVFERLDRERKKEPGPLTLNYLALGTL